MAVSQKNSAAPLAVTPPASVPIGFVPAVVVTLLVFAWPLYQLLRFSIGHQLYSHIVLIPLISLYLVWQQRETLPGASRPLRPLAVILSAVGLAVLGIYGFARSSPLTEREDLLALGTLAFLFIFGGVCSWFLGRATLRAVAFPLAFLVFMVPLPPSLLESIETALQYGSADCALGFFRMVGTPLFYHDLVFELPGIALRVAPECSGIHSTLALLITSVLAGYFFLRSPLRRSVLALAVIPLALVRNGFRVFVIGELCVKEGPQMIDSYIHRHGGPIFFVLSLIPFFLLLLFLVRGEKKRGNVVRVSSDV